MKHLTVITALPLCLIAIPAFAQAPAAPAPAAAAPAPAAAAPAPAPAAAAPAPVAATAAVEMPAPAVAAEPAPAPVPAPVADAPAKGADKGDEKAAPPDKIAVAKTGYFQPSVNLQAWFIAEHLGNARTDKDAWATSFRVRRAELKAKGDIIPKVMSYQVMFDPARLLDMPRKSVNSATVDEMGNVTTTPVDVLTQAGAYGGSTMLTGSATSILQDLQLTLMSEYADFSIGQFKTPVSFDSMASAAKLYFPERHLISRYFGDKRDLGFKIEKKFDSFSYLVGIYNGQGLNNLDQNDQKDLALRVEVFPIKELTLAVAGLTSVGDRDLPGTKDRVEGNLKFEKYGLLVQAEAIRGWDVTGSVGKTKKIKGQGFYVMAGYTLFDKLQPIVRFGSIDPEMGKDEEGATAIDRNDEINSYEFGLNYFLKKHDAKVQLSGSFFDPEQKVSKTTFDLILATQVAF